jgi:hypothetical protein
MTKYITGAVVGALLVLGVYAGAATQGAGGMSLVDKWQTNGGFSVWKVYDSDANVICYVYAGTGISCLKNN